MKHLFIVNPIAGGRDRTAEITRRASDILGNDYETYVTKGHFDAEEEVRRRGQSGEEYRIYSCGGDGTLNECCNGASGFANLAVAPFPLGTGNDFIRMFGSDAELFRDLKSLVTGKIVPIDLIDCNGRKCDCICSVGIDARVGTSVHNYPRWLGAFAYVVSLVVELTKGLKTQMKITCGETVLEGKFLLCCVCNARHYGGGFMPSATAMPNDGDLDIYVVKSVPLLRIITELSKYASGRSDECPDEIVHLHGDAIRIELEQETIINLDGEALSCKTADMKLLHHNVNLIVPQSTTFFD